MYFMVIALYVLMRVSLEELLYQNNVYH